MAEDAEDSDPIDAPTDEPAVPPLWWEMDGPIRETVFAYVQDRIRSLQVREETEGVKMLPGHKRELTVMLAVKALYDWHEQREQTALAEQRRGRRR